ncbi:MULTISPECIES: hypothetical protein [unclassified Streptomyces]|uniref:hypothetical protein n=1 Tax=unclassified Streptomyces TaxID=2593676 RepID=UPI0035E388CE
MTAVAVDLGSRYVRIARVGAHGVPELVELPGAVPGEGLPAPSGAGTRRGTALRAAYTAYRRHHDVPDRLVVVVPQQDRAEYARCAADTVAALHGTGRAPRVRALGTPHAVLTLLRYAGAAGVGRHAVCDLGATAAEVSVCVVTSGAVAVTGAARHAPADGYGACFDAALLSDAGLPDDEAGRLALAAVRAEDGAARRLDLALGRADRNPDRYDATAVHHVAGRDISAGAVRSALGRLTAGLDRALAEALGGGPVAHLVAVGGGARFAPLVRHLAGSGRPLTPLPAGTDPALAAVFGAALVAENRIDPADRYPYAVWVGAHRTVVGRPEDRELLISGAGVLEPGGPTVFAETDGQRLGVRTGPAGAAAGRPVRVRVRDPEGGGSAAVRTLTLPGGAEGDRFHVGVRIAVDGSARLVLHPLHSGTPSEFPLGNLPTDLRTDPEEVRL